MKFDDRLGIVHDTIFYGVAFFNFSKTKEVFENSCDNLKIYFKHYNNIKKELSDIPHLLYPFFYSVFSSRSFLSNFMFTKWNFFNDTFEDFLFKLQTCDNLKKDFVAHYITNIPCIEKCFQTNDFMPIIPEIIALSLEDDLKFEILNVLSQFDYALSVLIDNLKNIKIYVEKLHQKMYNENKAIVKQYSSKSTWDLFNTYCEITEDTKIDQKLISVSNLRCDLFCHRFIDSNHAFILGYEPEAVYAKISGIVNYNHLKPEIIFDVFSHPLRREILEKLNGGEYTATQLSELLFTSRQSVNAQLLLLNSYMFVKVVKTNGPEKYYILNYDTIRYAKVEMDKYMLNFKTQEVKD